MTDTPTRGEKADRYAKTVSVFDEPTNTDIERARKRLEAGWTWFERNADHPEFARREERWIEWLKEYEALIDRAREAA